MSHPTPSEKPSNPENPRVFFDVDVDGEKGQDVLNLTNFLLLQQLAVSSVSIAAGSLLVFHRVLEAHLLTSCTTSHLLKLKLVNWICL